MMVLGAITALVLAFLIVADVTMAKGGPGGSGRRGTDSDRVGFGMQSRGMGGLSSGQSVDSGAARGFRGSTGGNRGGFASDTLDPQEEQALKMAIDDEYKALATYLGVTDAFGQVTPFASIARAEQQHIAALERLFTRYGVAVPANEWIGNTPGFDSVADACAAGVQAEIDNAALYDELFSMVDNPDILRVFSNLRNASEYNHLPAFSNCQ
jgi:hypothetical protein